MKADLHLAALLAEKTLLRFGVDSLPVDPVAILQQIPNVRLMSTRRAREVTGITDARLLGTDASVQAALIGGEEGWLILYRKDISVEQRRYNFAHELGHLALRHGGGMHEMWQEQEADCFALHLLMPDPLMRRVRTLPQPVFA